MARYETKIKEGAEPLLAKGVAEAFERAKAAAPS